MDPLTVDSYVQKRADMAIAFISNELAGLLVGEIKDFKRVVALVEKVNLMMPVDCDKEAKREGILSIHGQPLFAIKDHHNGSKEGFPRQVYPKYIEARVLDVDSSTDAKTFEDVYVITSHGSSQHHEINEQKVGTLLVAIVLPDLRQAILDRLELLADFADQLDREHIVTVLKQLEEIAQAIYLF